MTTSLFTMEEKKEIYLSWVHYTTKNEEVYFRRFIKGFVVIWESQLTLNWEEPGSLPNCNTVKHDCGPHLSRLPEELLPAIGKFIYIAKDQADKGDLIYERLAEVDLLVRCLTAISRNFDNIPLIASCDYVSHLVSIAATLIHQLVDGTCEYVEASSTFCINVCHFLECLYDPYLTWRHFTPGVYPSQDRLVFHPALLHVEVIPFIYDCFHLNLVNKLPNISINLINILGAIVSGAQHNALRGICPATVSLLMRIISTNTTSKEIRAVVLQCFVAMIMVLHISPPHQRQIEVISLLEMYRDVMITLITTELNEERLATLVHLVQILNIIMLTPGSLHSLIVEAHIIDALLNMLQQSAKCSLDRMELATEAVKVVTGLVTGGPAGNDRMLKIDGYNRLFAELRSLGQPSRPMLEAVVAMAVDGADSSSENQKLKNVEPLMPLIHWIGEVDDSNQLWLSNTLTNICTSSLQSKTLACQNGTVSALCGILSSCTLNGEVAAQLILLLETLASHSLTAHELKQLFLLLRTEENVKSQHRSLVLQAVSMISRRASLQFDCNSYFDIEEEEDGISISDMKKWSGAVYGFSFHCWLRLEQAQQPQVAMGMTSSYRRQLFNFLTSHGTGMEAFVGSDGALVIGVNTKKEFLAATVPDYSLLDAQWHCLDICYMAARRPFGHNQLSVFIDGQQKLAASIKFPAMTDPFVTCTVGSATEKTSQNSNTNKSDSKSEKSSGSIMEKGLFPSLISQVPNYFSLPLRSSTPLDPHVKNFPPGMQDTLFGLPTCLQGQLGLICLFHETLTQHQVKALFDGGPNCRLLFSPEDNPDMLVLNSKLVWCFSPAACWDGSCLDLATLNKFTAKVVARQCHTHTIKDVINGIGGIQVLYPILESIVEEEGPDLSVFSQVATPTQSREDLDDWVVLSSTGYSESKLEQNPASSFLLLLKNLLLTSNLNQEQLLKNNGVAILGSILAKTPPSVMDMYILKALQLLLEMAKHLPNHTLLRSLHQHVLFNFNIWSHCCFQVRISHIQYISTIIKDERKVYRKRYGVQFFLDTIRRHYSSPDMVASDDRRAIRVSLLGLIKYYLQKECNVKELYAIMGFLATCKEEILVIEVLEMLIAQLESKTCKDQLFLLMYEPQAGDLLYCLLIDKHFTMDLKQCVLKLLSVLLRTEKIYERNKSRLRLHDSTTVGMYPGLIAMLPDQQFSMEFIAILLDQILLTESNGSYSGALSLLNALSLTDLDIKLEAARKLLTVTFMRPSAPQFLAKQVGWQDCVTRLLIKCPITSTDTETFPDLMVFDDDQDAAEVETTRSLSPTSVSRISDAAFAIENEIMEVAETVSNAVADNIHFAADNISSAMASAYTAIRQKTVEMQESLELGARSRLKKRRSFTSSDSQEPDGSSPRAVRTSMLLSSLGLDLDNISFGNRSQSSSSTEDLSSPTHTGENSSQTPARDSLSITSAQSLASQVLDEDSDEDERILFDALQQWKAIDAEKLEDKEQELCYLVVNILFTIMWRGVDVNSKDLWKERGQVMTCINLLALNNVLYCSHLELKLRLLEMAVTATLSDLRDSTQTPESAAQLIRWIYDLTVLDPNQDHSKRASTKLLDGVLALLDSLLVFQEIPGEEWTEMAKLAFGILLSCAANTNLELCAMATAKLHTLIQTRCMKDMEEGGYLLYYINSIVHNTLKNDNQEHISFLMPVVKALIEKCSDMFSISSNLPDLPVTHSGPVFYEDFQSYCQGTQWTSFIDKKIKPLFDSYQSALSGQLTEAMNVFWAECYEGSKTCIHRRNREVGESKLRFQSQILSGYRARQTEESVRFNNLGNQLRNQELLVQRRWKHLRDFFTGPRGAWRSSVEYNRHWRLSHHENFSRMRLKLCPNLHFNPHTDASNLRDNTGWLSRIRSEEVPLSLNISSAVVQGDTEDADYIPEEDLRSMGEPEVDGEVEAGKEKLVVSQECDLVILMSAVKGRLEVTTTHIYFFDLSPVKEDVERQDFKWPLSRLREIYLRRYNLRRSALEFFFVDQTNYFLNFTTKTRNRVVSRILGLRPPNLSYHSSRSPAELLRSSGLTQKWVNHEITNFEYLMQLNTIAGRTYNDLSQYPVFPWIIADYTSEELDLTNPATFRDLSRPIGVVNPRNEAEVRAKYDSFEDPSGTIAKFHYGTHYSNSAGVLHYLVRVEPFTSLHIELQSGRFDVADRQFHSIPQTWKLLMDNPNDVKELTPEFFYFPEFLVNMNKFDLGLLQVTKERVTDVILPNWAESAENFIYKHRKALESEYVSAHLHEWIDLIFGYKQKGPKAVEALNVFYYCSYEGAVDLDAITNAVEREAVEGMINNFGQTPSQLLKEPHPQRLTQQEALARMLKSDSRKPDITLFLDKLTPFNIEVSNEKDPIVFVSAPRSPPKGFLQAGMPDCLVTISKSAIIGVHGWLPHDRHSNKGFTLDIDQTLSSVKTRRSLLGSFHPSVTLHSQLFALSHDAKTLFTAGHWDSSVHVFSLTKNKVIASVIRHFDLVTCVSLDLCGLYLVSGSRDCTCVVWDISQLGGTPLRPVQTLYGHDKPITCVAIATELDMVTSGSLDGTVNVHTIKEGQYVHTLIPPGCTELTTEITFLSISAQGQVAIAAKDQKSHSVHVFSVNGENLGSKYVAGRVTGLTTAGDCLVVVDDAGDLTMSRLLGLHPVFDVPLHIPIQGVVVAPNNSHMLVPLRDGNIIVIGVPNS